MVKIKNKQEFNNRIRDMTNRIRDLREDMDLRQSDLAEKTGIDQRTISNYETGKTLPDSDALIKLADFFGVSIDYLVGRVRYDFYGASKRNKLIEQMQQELEELKELCETLNVECGKNPTATKLINILISKLETEIAPA